VSQDEGEADNQGLGLHGGELQRRQRRRVERLHHGLDAAYRKFRVLEPPHVVGGGQLAVPGVGHPLVQAAKCLLLPLPQLPQQLKERTQG
jgi:hypothetical protein